MKKSCAKMAKIASLLIRGKLSQVVLKNDRTLIFGLKTYLHMLVYRFKQKKLSQELYTGKIKAMEFCFKKKGKTGKGYPPALVSCLRL